MYNSQLIKLLKKLSQNEMRELGKFVRAPYYNTRLDVLELFNYIAKHHGDTPSVFEKEKIFLILFENQKYDDALMRYLIHQLLKIIKTYFIQKEMERDEVEMQIILSRAFRRRGLDDFFEKEIELATKMNEQNVYRDAGFHFKSYAIQSEKLKYITAQRRKGEVPYEAISQSLTHFFCTEVLRHNCEAQSYKAVIGRDLKMDFLDETIQWVESKMSESHPNHLINNISTKMYYHVLRMLQNTNNQHFEELKDLVNRYSQHFPKEEINFIYSAAMNYCVQKINMGASNYLDELFNLMQTGLEKKLFFENGFLSKFIYKNVVTTGLRLEKYQWVRQFLEDYKLQLHPKEREPSYHFNLAMYYFRLKDYNNAMDLLQKSDFGDTLSTLTAKGVLLKIYYETRSFDALMSLLESFSAFIHRQKNIGYLGKNYLNFIRFIRKMLNMNTKNAQERADLYDEVQHTQNVVEKEWLLEKLSKDEK